MSRAPTLLMFMTTSGHYDCKTIYRATLDHLDKLLPLNQWGARVCHVKAKPGHEPILEIMKQDLARHGFIVEWAVEDWARGQSHFIGCLKDQIKMSQHEAVYSSPYVYVTDDDYLPICHQDSFIKVLHKMTQAMEENPDLLTFRFLREQDADALASDRTISIDQEGHIGWSAHANWQPQILRSRDFYHMCHIIESHWQVAKQMHGEALWRDVLASLSRSPKHHAVWLPEYAQVANLGVENYLDVAKRFNLTIASNPSV